MHKLLLPILFLATVTGCTWSSGTIEVATSEPADERFAVYLVDTNEEVFSEDDVQVYDFIERAFVLTEDAANRLKPVDAMDPGLYQKQFVAKLGETELYRGYFWSSISSRSVEDIVITDALILSPEYPALRAANSYPASDSILTNTGIDDPRIREHFQEINKLKEY